MSFESALSLRSFVSLVRGTTYKGDLVGRPGPVLLGLASIQANGGFRRGSFKSYGGDSPVKITLGPGDVYVSLKDVTQSGDLLGSVARVPRDIAAGRLTQDTVKLQFDGKSISKGYVYWLLRTPDYRAYCRSHATGTTTLGLARDDFLNFPVVEPSDDELSLIELLESIEDRIALLRETNATLEAIAQALFKSWFVDFDPVRAKSQSLAPAGMDEVTAALFPDSFEESALGLVPKGWAVGTLGNVCINPRVSAKPEHLPEQTPYVGLEHMPRRSMALVDAGTAKGLESGKFWFERDDVLFGKLRPYFHKVALAPTRGVCSTDILVLRPARQSFLGFVAMHASSDALIAHATLLSNGARMPRSNWHDIAGFAVVLPPVKVAAAFNDVAYLLFERIYANVEMAKNLGETRDTLLPRLISGQLRLPKAEEALA